MLEKPGISPLRYLIVLSDGKDEGVGFKLDESIDKARDLNIPVYTLGFVSKAEQKYLDNMVRLAKMTDGQYRQVKTSQDIENAYSAIAGMILNQKILTLNVPIKGDGKNMSFLFTTTALRDR